MVNVLSYKIAAGMVEWGLIFGVLSFIMNMMFSALGYRSTAGKAADFLRVVITAPIVEEIIYRLVLISAFTFLFNSVLIAVLLSAVLFALGHLLYGGMTFLDCLVTGLVWGWAFLTLGLGVTIIAHMSHNLLAFMSG